MQKCWYYRKRNTDIGTFTSNMCLKVFQLFWYILKFEVIIGIRNALWRISLWRRMKWPSKATHCWRKMLAFCEKLFDSSLMLNDSTIKLTCLLQRFFFTSRWNPLCLHFVYKWEMYNLNMPSMIIIACIKVKATVSKSRSGSSLSHSPELLEKFCTYFTPSFRLILCILLACQGNDCLLIYIHKYYMYMYYVSSRLVVTDNTHHKSKISFWRNFI